MIKCLYYRVENGRSVRPGRSERPYCACGTFSQVSQFQEVGRFAWRPLLPVLFYLQQGFELSPAGCDEQEHP